MRGREGGKKKRNKEESQMRRREGEGEKISGFSSKLFPYYFWRSSNNSSPIPLISMTQISSRLSHMKMKMYQEALPSSLLLGPYGLGCILLIVETLHCVQKSLAELYTDKVSSSYPPHQDFPAVVLLLLWSRCFLTGEGACHALSDVQQHPWPLPKRCLQHLLPQS